MVQHAGFTIQDDEADSEALVGDVLVLLLVFENVFDHGELLGCGETANRVVVDALLVSEVSEFGGFLELVHPFLKIRLFGGSAFGYRVEVGFGFGFGVCRDRFAKNAMKTTIQGRHRRLCRRVFSVGNVVGQLPS